jgi:hypothetical protein
MSHDVVVFAPADDSPLRVELSFDGNIFAEYELDDNLLKPLLIYGSPVKEPLQISLEEFNSAWSRFTSRIKDLMEASR